MTDASARAIEKQSYCTVSQAAALLGVSRVSVWRWIRDGYLPATRLGPRTIQIKREDVDRARFQIQPRGSRSWVAQNRSAVAAAVDATTSESLPELTEPLASDHAVQFYEDDAFLVNAIAEFIGDGLHAGDSGIVVSTKQHRGGIEAGLRAAGFDLSTARATGQYTALDATETLARFMVDGIPDAERFAGAIEPIVSRAAEGGRKVRIFGEMVALLAADGDYAAALHLEELWNTLQRTRRFSLLCAYSLGSLGVNPFPDVIGDVCCAHSRVIPAESYTRLPTADDRLVAIVELQRKSHWLQNQIDKRERTEEQLRIALAAAQDTLQEAVKSQRKRDELVSIAAQELKHPIYSLSLQAQHALLRLGRETRLQPERVEKAVEAVTGQPAEISRLVGQMVEFSRIEAGRLTLLPRWVDLPGLLKSVVEDMRLRGNRHEITLAAPSALEAWIDAERTEQVLTNLIDNAIRYSPDGGTIDVALTHAPSVGATLTVWDRGRGIPTEKRGALFEHNEPADTNTTHESGLGLGLFVSRQIAELHGGELYAEFPTEGGTRLVMRLPVGLDDPIAQAAAD